MKELTGVIPITATPFDSEGRVASYVRPPGPTLDDVTRAELRAILERSKVLNERSE